MTMLEHEFTELIRGLPEDLALECLTRLHHTTHSLASRVCHRWRRLVRSRDFYYHRKRYGFTREVAVFVQSEPVGSGSRSKEEIQQPEYGLSVYDPSCRSWERVDPNPEYSNGLPLFCRVVSTEGKLVVLGGWDPVSWEPVTDVFVYEFTTRRWTRCANMPYPRSFFAKGAYKGKVYIAGGHDVSKNALKTSFVYDLEKDEWTELTQMSEERDECEGIWVGSELWVVSGYDTNSQGRFKSNADVLNIESGTWRRVEDAWCTSQCPRGRVVVKGDGALTCWGEGGSDSGVQVGTSIVGLGDQVIVTGSDYHGGPHGFFLVEKSGGLSCKLVKLEVPDDFSGFVQSGCYAEI